MSLFVCGLASPPSLLPPRAAAAAHNLASGPSSGSSAKLSPTHQARNALLIRTETKDHPPHHQHHQLLQQQEAIATCSGERHAEEEPSSERSAAAAADAAALSPLSRRWLAQQERLSRHRCLLDETEERNAIRCILALLCPTAAAALPPSSRTAAAASPLIPGKDYQPVKGVVQLPRSMLKQQSTTTPSAAAAADPVPSTHIALPAPSVAGGAAHRPRPPPSKLSPPSLLRITTLEEAIAAKQQADAFYRQVPQALHCRAKKTTTTGDVLEQRPLPHSSVHASSSLLLSVDGAAQSTGKAMGEELPPQQQPQQYTAKVGTTVVRVVPVPTGEDNDDGSGGGESPYASQLQPLVVACPTSDDEGTAAPLLHGATCDGINPPPRNQTLSHHDNKHNHHNKDVSSPSRQPPGVVTRRPPPPLAQHAAARGGRQPHHCQHRRGPNNQKRGGPKNDDGQDRDSSLLLFTSEELGPAIDADILRQYNQLTVRSGVLALLGAAAAQQALQKLKEEEEEGRLEHKETSVTDRCVAAAAAALVGCGDECGDGEHDDEDDHDDDGEVSEPQYGDVEEEDNEAYASMWGLDPPSGAVLQLLTNGPASAAAARASGKATRRGPTTVKPTAPRQRVATLDSRSSPCRGGRPGEGRSSPAQEATSVTVGAPSSSPPPRSVGSPLPFWQRQLNLLTTHSNNNNNNNNKIHRANSSVTSDPMSGGTPASSMTVSPSSRHASMTTLPPLLPNSSASAALVDGHFHQSTASGAVAGGSSAGNGIHRRSLSSQQPQPQQSPKTDEEVFQQFMTRLERQVQSWEGAGGEPSSSKRRGSRRLTREGSLSHGAAAAAATTGGGGALRSFDSFQAASPSRKKSQGGAGGGGGAVFVGEDGMRWTSPQQHYESGNVSTSSLFHRHHRATSFVM